MSMQFMKTLDDEQASRYAKDTGVFERLEKAVELRRIVKPNMAVVVYHKILEAHGLGLVLRFDGHGGKEDGWSAVRVINIQSESDTIAAIKFMNDFIKNLALPGETLFESEQDFIDSEFKKSAEHQQDRASGEQTPNQP